MHLRRFIIISAAIVWIVGLAIGIRKLHAFESVDGKVGSTPTLWPAASGIPLDPTRPTLIMFVHPECSCSRASLSELRALMGAINRPITVRLLFVQPTNASLSAIWHEANDIPGVTVGVDLGGTEAERFGALTSGYSVAYQPSGSLVFSGGITSARGHAGNNMGLEMLIKSLGTEVAPPAHHAVFGCSLANQHVRGTPVISPV